MLTLARSANPLVSRARCSAERAGTDRDDFVRARLGSAPLPDDSSHRRESAALRRRETSPHVTAFTT